MEGAMHQGMTIKEQQKWLFQPVSPEMLQCLFYRIGIRGNKHLILPDLSWPLFRWACAVPFFYC
jgi:cephalosporin-C deacetylase-like acetyl esterase